MLIRKPATHKITGVTLLETMLALAVGALVLMAAVIFYTSTRTNANVSKTLQDMSAIKAGYKAYFASGYTFESTLTDVEQLQVVQDAGFLPKPLNNAWGQAYTISVNNKNYPGYIVIGIPGLGVATTTPSNSICQTIWVSAQTTGALNTKPSNLGNVQCAFRYTFP